MSDCQKEMKAVLLKNLGYLALIGLFSVFSDQCAYTVETFQSGEPTSLPMSYPTLEGDGCEGVKEEILAFAKDAFLSPIPSWWDFSKFQSSTKAPYAVWLAPDNGAYQPDTTKIAMASETSPSGEQTAYWAIDPMRGTDTPTFMILQQPGGGWRGDFYSIQWGVPNSQAQDPASRSLMDGALKLPLLLKITDKNLLIAIDTGYQYKVVSSWKVYVPGKVAPSTCFVHFHPKIKNAWDLVPQASSLYAFGKLVSDMIGLPSQDEGTLQMTAMSQSDFNKMYMLVLTRPWAIVTAEEPYNTTQEVEEGLKQWSQKKPAYLRQYQEFQTLYPQAQRELTTYYETKFQYEPEAAQKLAKANLDKAFRVGLVFSKGTD